MAGANERSTVNYQTIDTSYGPMTVLVPNTTMDGDGFYVSFNDTDIGIYGDVTTALVVGQMQQFYILKGDFRQQYAALIPSGLDACFQFFRQNLANAHPHSDKLPQ